MTNHDGMVPREQWTESDVHKASRYACGWCGAEFETPRDFYDHLDTAHPKKSAKENKRVRSR